MMYSPEHSENSERRLRGATGWQWNPVKTPEPLTGSVERFLSQKSRHFERSERILIAWENTLPDALKRVCCLESYNGGTLTISVQTGPYLHQIQMMQKELLEELKRQCPKIGLQRIKILPGHADKEPDDS